MNIYSEAGKAQDHMVRRYLQSRKEQCFHLFACRIGRVKFYAVLSEEEMKKHKVNRKESLGKVGICEEQKEVLREISKLYQ